MRCGIVTYFSYCNYGAALQSYALSKVLESLGHEAEFIDYRNKIIYHPFSLENLKVRGPVGYVYTTMGNLFYRPRRASFAAFRERLHHTMPLEGIVPPEFADKYDCYIAGSDQIWNVPHTHYDSTYFLDFVADPRKKVSYAASFGGRDLDAESREFVAAHLKDFRAISVREEYAADLVGELLGARPKVTQDPTMLLTKEEWDKIAEPPQSTAKPFVLTYQLGFSGQLVKEAREFSKCEGLPLEYVPFPLGGAARARLNLALSPEAWLARFRDAEYILTDSFHGVVFALIYGKKFSVVADGQHKNQRAVNLLTTLGLESRVSTPDHPCDPSEEIDYETVYAKLAEMRTRSIAWLAEQLDEQL